MLVGNFTPDDIKWTHLGIIGTLKAGEIDEFDENRAKHILTKFGQRGLLQVKFENREDLHGYRNNAMEIYKQFWEHQVYNHNSHNAVLKNEGKAYIPPTKELARHAKEIGLEISGPWLDTKKTETKQIQDLKAENDALKAEMSDIKGMMGELLQEMRSRPVREIVTDTETDLRKFRNLGKDRYKNWVVDNMNEIPMFPFKVYEQAFEKWISMYKGEPWPVAKCQNLVPSDNSGGDDGNIS
jgi:cell division protein FtsB